MLLLCHKDLIGKRSHHTMNEIWESVGDEWQIFYFFFIHVSISVAIISIFDLLISFLAFFFTFLTNMRSFLF